MQAGFTMIKNRQITVNNGGNESVDSNMNKMLSVKQDYYKEKSVTKKQGTQNAKYRWV